ncbi:MAG: arsenite methyltransferase [Cyclobacteriaceae bacterium]|nr:arsenite methyltransferase [Cyclobacteriaceae bacterium]MDH4295203.1 arsenite methyltransferase [Cyclobacteriaceae bacterium]MDH5248907.1 arsenite methyltransferase [Cyclobacteriaceae bacterium]
MKTQETAQKLKEIVKEKYSQIAAQSRAENAASCCGSTCGCSTLDMDIMAEDYTALEGYVADADLGLGCGLPTAFAIIKEGDTVVDLGSGAGNDAFVARSIVGENGKVIGIDMTEEMISKARLNTARLGFNNIEFRLGDIEAIPLDDGVADVVVSNCVLNLVPNKVKAFTETFRILKPGGHFSVSDIVLEGKLSESLLQSAEMYAGCVSGAIQKDDYLSIIADAGFENIQIQKEKKITIPDEILSTYLDHAALQKHKAGQSGIYSITVYADKPAAEMPKKKDVCCAPGCCDA